MMHSLPLYRASCGITLRQDSEAMFGYLPQEGFAFYAPATDFDTIKNLLARKSNKGFPSGYERLSKNGITPFPPNQARHLGNPDYHWETLPLAERPLVINWMLTGCCNYKCAYCYAQDVMATYKDDLDKDTWQRIIDNIKSYQPLVVVVTGGEPTLSPFFEDTIEQIARFSSVVVDTNGTNLTHDHAHIFKKYNVHVRISIDSNRPSTNIKSRKPKKLNSGTVNFDNIWKNLILLSRMKIPVTVNTVATTYNYDDIISLSCSLKKFNIKKLRVRLVENSKTITNYKQLLGNDRRVNRFITYTSRPMADDMSIPIYLSTSRQRNSVILVAPSGYFCTESQFVEQGKILIDPDNPQKPSLDAIRRRVDMHAHSSRYLFI